MEGERKVVVVEKERERKTREMWARKRVTQIVEEERRNWKGRGERREERELGRKSVRMLPPLSSQGCFLVMLFWR